VFRGHRLLSLLSDAIVPGDVQILGDGTPIVLMRDHQPTGGYPRIATLVSADIDRFAQLRPGSEVRFEPVTLKHALELKP
jgi:allophanate hydrolase subunit 2